MKTLEALGVYIHIPFCVQKCLYCDFLSYDNQKGQMGSYVERLIGEIYEKRNYFINKAIRTVYFGGGTPSLLPPKAIAQIVGALKDLGNMDLVEEMTLEANPGTLTQAKVAGYLAAGINRVSMGLQSACDEELRAIGRIHSYEDFLESYRLLRENGCKNINIDLMTGLPGQTVQSFREGLFKVLALNPEHLSCYGLTLEEGTPLYAMVEEGRVSLDDGLERDMHEVLLEETRKAGYEHYEISNFAKPGFQSRHNNIYWEMGDYLGLGLGASSFIEGRRFKNTEIFDLYMDKDVLVEEETEVLDQRSWKEEWMFLGLRKMAGVSRRKYKDFFGNTMDEDYGEVISQLVMEGLLAADEAGIRLTKKGLTFANSVFRRFLLD